MEGGGARFPLNEYYFTVTGDDPDSFRELLENEREFMEALGQSRISHPQSSRTEAVKFLDNLIVHYMSECKYEEFDAMIPYMAMTYYDRFAWKKLIPSVWIDFNQNMFALCCISIAWKFLIGHIPFPLGKYVNPKFQRKRKTWLKMELHLCRHLEWKFNTITPIMMADNLIPFLCLPPSAPSPRRPIRDLIVKSLADIPFTQFMPSDVAASALLTVSSDMFPNEFNQMEAEIFYTFPPLSKEIVAQCRKKFSRWYKHPPRRIFPKVYDPMADGPSGSSSRVTGKRKMSEHLSEPVVAEDEYMMNFKLDWSQVLDAQLL